MIHTIPCNNSFFVSEARFNTLYPSSKHRLSDQHWTPIPIARAAAGFLGQDAGCRILDIGAGIGKFCLVAAAQQPRCHFVGIEQRKNLVRFAESARRQMGAQNVSFLTGDFQQVDFSHFDHFYFFNSFYENLAAEKSWIDNKVAHSLSLYEYYTNRLQERLAGVPAGTRLVTYHSFHEVVPASFKLVGSARDTMLRYWIKH